MITIRPSDERGTGEHGWLTSRHSFSFSDYVDPAHMGFRALRVINEDRVAPGAGFPTHGHRDMEIISYVLEGALEHKDTTGTNSVIRPGEVQRMTAGTGIRHSEYNHSEKEPVHFLQIWILPEKDGLSPGYEQRAFPIEKVLGQLHLVASRDGRNESVTVHQDVDIYAARLNEHDKVLHTLKLGRHVWIQVARGQVRLNGNLLNEGDGAAVTDEDQLKIVGETAAEVLLFDLA